MNGLYDFLAKIGFPDPLHPPITHMPIGLAVGAFVFILIAVIFRKKNVEITVRHVSILAFIFAFPTILLGVLDWIHYYRAVLFTPIAIKMALAAILLVELAVGIILGNELKLKTFLMAVFSSVGFVAVIGLGWFGSGIMYGRGIDMPLVGPSPTASPAPAVSAAPSVSPAASTSPAASPSAAGGASLLSTAPPAMPAAATSSGPTCRSRHPANWTANRLSSPSSAIPSCPTASPAPCRASRSRPWRTRRPSISTTISGT